MLAGLAKLAQLALAASHLVFPLSERLEKRAAELTVHNGATFYYVTLEIGTPAQQVEVIIDTGSSDLWVPEQGGTMSSSRSIFFDPQNSTSFLSNGTEFVTGYVDGSVASGTWGTDTVVFGSNQLENVSMGIAQTANTTSGILGLGLAGLESTVTGTLDGEPINTYSNFPMLIKEQGFIDYLAFSLSLAPHKNSSHGSLIFGGVDTSAYHGDLQLVPLVRTSDSNSPQSTTIMLHGILSKGSDVVTCSIPVLLDSGTSISHLPGVFVEAISEAANATYQEDLGVYVLPCSSKFELTLNMSGVHANMTASELIPLTSSSGEAATSNGEAMCMLPFTASTESYILGIGALRGMYLVFDYESLEVAIAPRGGSGSGDIVSLSDVSPQQAPMYSSTASSTAYKLHVSIEAMSGVSSQIQVTSLESMVATSLVTATASSSTVNAAVGGPQLGGRGSWLDSIFWIALFI